MSEDLVVREAQSPEVIREQMNQIQNCMKMAMKQDVHYGIIPGCNKPSLYKPGSEKILSMFRIAVEPEVEDISSGAEEVRYRVTVRLTHQPTGLFLGSGIGECSSSEEKYAWRKAVCDEEFDATEASKRRVKWFRGRGNPYSVKQVRTNPHDVANTVLKMAKKRAQIDGTLTCTAASDIFDQDIEDLPEGMAMDGHTAKPPVKQPERKRKPKDDDKEQDPNLITEKQRKRFYAICKKMEASDEAVKLYLKDVWGLDSSKDIPKGSYNDIVAEVEAGKLSKFEIAENGKTEQGDIPFD